MAEIRTDDVARTDDTTDQSEFPAVLGYNLSSRVFNPKLRTGPRNGISPGSFTHHYCPAAIDYRTITRGGREGMDGRGRGGEGEQRVEEGR